MTSALKGSNDASPGFAKRSKEKQYARRQSRRSRQELQCRHSCPCLSLCSSEWIWPLSVWPLKSEKTERDRPRLKASFSQFTRNEHTLAQTHVKRVSNKQLYQEFENKEALAPLRGRAPMTGCTRTCGCTAADGEPICNLW